MLVYNGEVYNHPELRAELEQGGERFETSCDTEVVLRLLEREGPPAFERLNGQFAFAWWNPRERRLTMVRDRFGVRPLYYALGPGGTLVFGSEAKALFASGIVEAKRDLAGIDEVFTLWAHGRRGRSSPACTRSRRAARHLGAREIVAERRLVDAGTRCGGQAEAEGELERILRDSVRLRLRADVPVGTYLSGGLDSSLITALARAEVGDQLRTFRSPSATRATTSAPTRRRWPGRSGPVTTWSRSARPRSRGRSPTSCATWRRRWCARPRCRWRCCPRGPRERITVVASGEGADELFWCYDLFKEVVLRELNARDPQRAGLLVDELYDYLGAGAARRGPMWRQFLLETGAADELLGSHLTRAHATATVKALYRPESPRRLAPRPRSSDCGPNSPPRPRPGAAWSAPPGWMSAPCSSPICCPPRVTAWRWPTGSRVASRSSTIGCSTSRWRCRPTASSTSSTTRSCCASWPRSCFRRGSRHVRSSRTARPRSSRFFAAGPPVYVDELLSESALEDSGLWDPERVAGLVRRCRAGRATGVREGWLLVGVLSTQLFDRAFLGVPVSGYSPETAEPRVRIDRVGGGAEVA